MYLYIFMCINILIHLWIHVSKTNIVNGEHGSSVDFVHLSTNTLSKQNGVVGYFCTVDRINEATFFQGPLGDSPLKGVLQRAKRAVTSVARNLYLQLGTTRTKNYT